VPIPCPPEGAAKSLKTTDQLILKTLVEGGLMFIMLDYLTYVTDRPGHDERYALDASKLKRLGWKPNHALSVHLPKTVLWYKDNTGWTLKTTRNRKQFNKHIKSPALGSEKKMGYFAKGKRQ